jgi:hypothetical protein
MDDAGSVGGIEVTKCKPERTYARHNNQKSKT